MSGYGGQPPGGQGWQDPYGQYGQDPYGQQSQQSQQGWQDPYAPQGYGYGPPGAPSRSGDGQGAAIAALICNCVATLLCCAGFSVVGIITAAIALSRSQTDPESARSLTMWSWAMLVLNIVVLIALIAALIVFGVFSTSAGYAIPNQN